jgi:DNA-directed RNA polymerase specialized sigma24 family protein
MPARPDMPNGSDGVRFPATRHSAIIGLRSDDSETRRRAIETVAQVYWRPVYAHVRLRWNRDPDDARDLTQGFFLQVIEKDFLASFDPQRARFRTFLRVCLDRHVQREDTAESRQKRGGEINFVALDTTEIEQALVSSARDSSPDSRFDLEWVRSLLTLSGNRLRENCHANGRDRAYKVFERHDLRGDDGDPRPTYADLAAEFGTTVEDITNQLAYARREFRSIVLDLLREMTVSEEEFRDEARALLGIEIK